MTRSLPKLVVIALMLCIAICMQSRAKADSTTQPPNGTEAQTAATAGPTLDIANYELVKEIVKDNPDDKEWKNTLTFRNTDIRIPLPGTCNTSVGGIGLDQASLKIQWVIPNHVMWIRWNTIPQGSGSYCSEAHVLLLVENGKATELTRQGFFASGGTGAAGCFRQSASFELDDSFPGTPQILRRISHYYKHWESHQTSPMAVKSGESGDSWVTAYRFIEEACFVIADGRLMDSSYGPYSLRLDLSAPRDTEDRKNLLRAEFPIEDVAEFLVPYVAPRYGHILGSGECTEGERNLMVRDLRQRNHLNDAVKTLHGTVEVPYSGPPVFVPLKPTDDYYPFRLPWESESKKVP